MRFLGGPNRPKICVGRTKPDFKDRAHTPDVCKDIKFLSLEDLDKLYTHHSVEGLASRRKGVHFGSAIANNLLPLRDIAHYFPPVILSWALLTPSSMNLNEL